MGKNKWLIALAFMLAVTSGCSNTEKKAEAPVQQGAPKTASAPTSEPADRYAPTLGELWNARLEVPGAGAPFGHLQETAQVTFIDGHHVMSKIDFAATMSRISAATWFGQEAVRVVFLTYMNGALAYSLSHVVAYNSDLELVAYADLAKVYPEVGTGWVPGVTLVSEGGIGLYWNGLCSNAFPGAGLACLRPDQPGWMELVLSMDSSPGKAIDKTALAGFRVVDRGGGYPAWAGDRPVRRKETTRAAAPETSALAVDVQQGIMKGAELDSYQSPLTELPANTDLVQTVFTLLDALEKADESFVWALTRPVARRALEAPPAGQRIDALSPTPQTVRELLAAVGQQNLLVNWCSAGSDLPRVIPQINEASTYCLLVPQAWHSTAGGINLLVQLPGQGQGNVAVDIVPLDKRTAADLSTASKTNIASAQTALPLTRTFTGPYAFFFNGDLEVPAGCLADGNHVEVMSGFGRSGQSFVYMRPPVVPFPAAGPDALVVPLECHYQGVDLFHERIGVYNSNGQLLGQIALRDTPDGDDGEAGIIEKIDVVDGSGNLSPQGDRLRVQWKNHFEGGDVTCHLCFEGTASAVVQWTGSGFNVVGP